MGTQEYSAARAGLTLDSILLTDPGVELALRGAPDGSRKPQTRPQESHSRHQAATDRPSEPESDETAVVGLLGRLMVETCCLRPISSVGALEDQAQFGQQLEQVRERYGSELHQLLDKMTHGDASRRPKV